MDCCTNVGTGTLRQREPCLEQFRNWCRPKRQAFSWFSPKENHTSRSFSVHGNCELL